MQAILQGLPGFLLVFCRITSFFVTAPVFSSRGVPAQFKIGTSFFISLITFTVVRETAAFPQSWNDLYIVMVLGEILIGLLLGFTAYLFFTVVQVAGSFIDLQMGLGIANVIDPMTGAQSPVMGSFKFILAILFFLTMNGHHYLLISIMESYQHVTINHAFFTRIYQGDISNFLLETFVFMFYLAFQMAAPLVASLFLVDVALGMLARVAPQFNIFVIGIPVKILAGFLVLLILVGGFLFLFRELFEHMFASLNQLISVIDQGASE